MAFEKNDFIKSEAQWELMQPMLPSRKPRGRPTTNRRVIFDAMLYVVKTGVHWRSLPSDLITTLVKEGQGFAVLVAARWKYSTRRSRVNKSYSLRVVMRVVELCLNVTVPANAELASDGTEEHLGVWPGWPAAAGGSARAVAQARVADLLRRGLSAARFLLTVCAGQPE